MRSKRHASSGDSSIGGTRSVTDEGAARCDGAIGTTHYIVGFSPLTIDFHILCGIMLPRCKIRIYPRFMTRHVCRYSLKGRYKLFPFMDSRDVHDIL